MYDVPIKKDGKWYMCRKLDVTVKGGTRVVYITEDGTEIKSEPLFRYTERMNRRKTNKSENKDT